MKNLKLNINEYLKYDDSPKINTRDLGKNIEKTREKICQNYFEKIYN